MNVLIVGGGNGSWQVRGVQLGRAIGARVKTALLDADLAWADLVVLVKHAGPKYALMVHAAKKPIVWDALDFWEQPEQNSLDEKRSKALLQEHIHAMQPRLVIGANASMGRDAKGVHLQHHAWPGLTPQPPRPVSVVGYQGTKKYLGTWAEAIQAECDRRGWRFVINPERLQDCDLIVAFRDGQWDGWMCREWKSGVKLVNAMAAGKPIITQSSASFREILPMGATIEYPGELSYAFERCAEHEIQLGAACQWTGYFSLEQVAERYKALLSSVVEAKAA